MPWSEQHLAMASGYGAGVASPGWYRHLWEGGRPLVETWLVRVARLLRDDGFDISPAHLIEAARLAETTAALRGRSTPGLDEVNEAIRAVLTFGSSVPLALISERLIIGTELGAVPASVATAPLARDLAAEQRRLRLTPAVTAAAIDLDLRREIDIGRSHLFHRLLVLDVPWAVPAEETRRVMGTFRETVDAPLGPDVRRRPRDPEPVGEHRSATRPPRGCSTRPPRWTVSTCWPTYLERSLYADLPEATAGLTARIGALAAVAADVAALLSALPALARSLRYGSVRGHDPAGLGAVVQAMLQRAAIGLPSAVAGLDDDGAAEMVERLEHGAEAVGILDEPALRDIWADALRTICDRGNVHGRIAGRAGRLLLDDRRMDQDEAATRLAAALSQGAGPEYTIGYLDGFLAGSGMLLVHDRRLFGLVDDWLATQSDDGFTATLPYLRRTFARFTAAERRSLRDQARARTCVRATRHPDERGR